MNPIHIALIGVGRMGTVMAKGWLRDPAPDMRLSLIAPRPSAPNLALAQDKRVTLNPSPMVADIVVIAVKPQIFPDAIADIEPWIGPETLVLSIMAGFRLDQLAGALKTGRIIRAMPNVAGAIGKGVSLISHGTHVTPDNSAVATTLLSVLGHVEGPMPEGQMPVATALSGCGPAYVFLLAEAMANAGENEGLAPDLALKLAKETIIGAASLMQDDPRHPSELRDSVTSKSGVTEAALDVLMDGEGIPTLMRKAVRAAANRERTLSNSR